MPDELDEKTYGAVAYTRSHDARDWNELSEHERHGWERIGHAVAMAVAGDIYEAVKISQTIREACRSIEQYRTGIGVQDRMLDAGAVDGSIQ